MIATFVSPDATHACDVCAIYTATEQREARTGFRLGVAEQFSRFTTLQRDGEKIDNPGEHLNSTITQLILGGDFTPHLGVQFTLPIVSRSFRRREEGVIVSGDETGVGDASLIGLVRPYSYVDEERVVRFSLFGGLEFPTGSAQRLAEEVEESEGGEEGDHHEAARLGRAAEHHEGHDHEDDGPIGVHGHDLALGSGSWDGVIGGTVFASWRRLFFTTSVQYAIRTEGSFDYRYANDLTWTGGPGLFAYLVHEKSLSVQALVTGEHKGKDTIDGQEADDTGITAVYVGPGISFTWGTTFTFDIAADLPVLQDNTAVQIVPDFRIRGGLGWRF